MTFLRSILPFAFVIFLLITRQEISIVKILCGTIGGLLIALIYGVVRLDAPIIRFKGSLNFSFIKQLLKYGSHLYVGGLFAYLNVYVVQFVVLIFFLPSQLSFYTIAQQNSQLFQKISDAVSVFLFPRIASTNSQKDSLDLIFKIFRTLIIILMPAVILAFIFLKPLVVLTYGVRYLPALPLMYIMIPAIVFSTSTSAINVLFQGTGRPSLVYRALLLPIMIQVAIAYFMMPTLGTVGAAIAFSIGAISTGVSQLFFVKRKYSIQNLGAKMWLTSNDVKEVYGFFMSTFSRKAPVV